ncbi:Na/Pi cotransporter family protein [Pelagibacterium sp.]|uniref:Na/Pi cotransporter family protein n=1 Tax=Pelagibacterium sp. TaxID=1967288 RepID=UPI003A8D3376
MTPVLTVIHIAAAVMLLLWSVRMVRTGMERAFGSALRTALRKPPGGYVGMAVVGTGLAMILQSATAVGILAAGFASSGVLTVPLGIAAMVGADLGSAIVVKILSYDLSEAIPILLLIGATLFLKFESRNVRQIGRVLLGVAFILLSLSMIGDATDPLRDNSLMPLVAGYLQGDPITALLLAAILAWAMHSSVAALLLLAGLTQSGALPIEAALPMVLGANIGGALVAVWLTRGSTPIARRIPIANLIFRCVWVLAAIPSIGFMANQPWLGSGGAALVNFHVLFNLILTVTALPFVGLVARLCARLLPERPEPEDIDQSPASVLDRNVLHVPGLALASARREVLAMGEVVGRMLAPVIDLLQSGKKEEITRVRRLDEAVNKKHSAIKLFIVEVNRGQLSEDEARAGLDLVDFAISLEHVGDIVAKTLMPLADARARNKLSFSREGWEEISALHARVEANLQLALNVLLSGDTESARQLVREKEIVRRMERQSHDRHLDRLRAAKPSSIETSDLHLEILRALKEVNSLLVTVAYPILNEAGELRETRLVEDDDSRLSLSH